MKLDWEVTAFDFSDSRKQASSKFQVTEAKDKTSEGLMNVKQVLHNGSGLPDQTRSALEDIATDLSTVIDKLRNVAKDL